MAAKREKKPVQEEPRHETAREPGTTPQKGQSKPKKVSPPKAKRPAGTSTTRVSEKPQPSQPGPSEETHGKVRRRTTDTRGTQTTSSKRPEGKALKPKRSESLEEFRARAGSDLPHSIPGEDQVPTAADVAYAQPIRAKNPELPTPIEEHKVEGEPVLVVAKPGRVDPVEVRNVSDAYVKDRLRAEGRAEEADAPSRRPEGGSWETAKGVKL